MKKLGLKHRQYFVKSYLNPAITEGLIERTIGESLKSKKTKVSAYHQRERIKNEII